MSGCSDRRFHDMLGPYQFGMLDEAEIRELELHILDCPHCLKEVREFSHAGHLVRHDADVREAVEAPTDESGDMCGAVPLDSDSQPTRRWLRPRFIPVFVAAAAVFVLLILQPWDIQFHPTNEAVAGRKMLAVLPFENLGSDNEEYFADGMTEEITSRLVGVGGLGVISRTSTLQYKNTTKPIRQIGKELGVSYVLVGTVRWDHTRDSDRVRITPQLIRVADDTYLWSDRYQRPLEDVFAVQSEIAVQVVSALNVTLLDSERATLEARPTDNLAAYNAYLRGREHFFANAAEGIDIAIRLFERAVELDSGFALADAYLSKALSMSYHAGLDRSDECGARAKAAAERALILQPSLPEAHKALGFYYLHVDNNPDEALREFTVAAKSLPNDPLILMAIAYAWRRQGKWTDALQNLLAACELSPRDADPAWEVGNTYKRLRRYNEALRYYDQSISLRPDLAAAYASRASIYLLKGDLDGSRAALSSCPADSPMLRAAWCRQLFFERNYQAALTRLYAPDHTTDRLQRTLTAGEIHWLMGNTQRARALFDSAAVGLAAAMTDQPSDSRLHSSLGIAYAYLGRNDDAIREGALGLELMPPSKDALSGPGRLRDLALIYAVIGDQETAIDRLVELLSMPSPYSVAWLSIDPIWDSLRENPRFQALLEKDDVIFNQPVL